MSSAQYHRVWRLPAEVDTDQLAPGHAMKMALPRIAKHCLERVRPEFASSVVKGDVLVAGRDFGLGSSREQAAGVLVHLGVKAVIAPSYAGLYFRNAFNLGLLLITCKDCERITDGEQIRIDLGGGYIQRANAEQLAIEPVPDFLLDMVKAGGLLPLLKLQRSLAA